MALGTQARSESEPHQEKSKTIGDVGIRLDQRVPTHDFGIPVGTELHVGCAEIVLVAISGIEKIYSGVERTANQLVREFRAHFENSADILVAGGKCHRAEGQARNNEAGVPQRCDETE